MDKKLLIGIAMIIIADVIGAYQMFILKESTFVLYAITMGLLFSGIYKWQMNNIF